MDEHVSLGVEAFRANGYAVVRGAVPTALCEALVEAIGKVYGLDADRAETWYRDPPLAWDIVPVWGHQAQWDIRQHPTGCVRSGACFPAWPGEPGHNHVEPWAPPLLTDLGERLAGLRDWP